MQQQSSGRSDALVFFRNESDLISGAENCRAVQIVDTGFAFEDVVHDGKAEEHVDAVQQAGLVRGEDPPFCRGR